MRDGPETNLTRDIGGKESIVGGVSKHITQPTSFPPSEPSGNTTRFGAAQNDSARDADEHFCCTSALRVSAHLITLVSLYLVAVTARYQFVLQRSRRLEAAKCTCTVIVLLLLAQAIILEFEVVMVDTDWATFCPAYYVINVVLGCLSRMLVYVVTWMRQHGMHEGNPKPRHRRTLLAVSRSTIVGIVVGSVMQIVTLSLVPQYHLPDGCRSAHLDTLPLLQALIPSVFSLSTAFQLVLLGLTVYPIMQHLVKYRRNSHAGKLEGVVVRLSACAFVCVASDCAFVAIVNLFGERAPYDFIPLCYAYNSVINIVALLMSFADARSRLWLFANSKPAVAAKQAAFAAMPAQSAQ